MGNETAWNRLKAKYPWPEKQPSNQGVTRAFGWLHPLTMEVLRRHLNEDTGYVVELGTWLGLSARFILRSVPNAKIVCIDHWQGSPEMKQQHGHLFGDSVYLAFLHHNWHLRDRITPVRLPTLAGVAECRELSPDLVYVDAAHDAGSVKADVLAVADTWPGAVIVGDDWEARSEHYAVAKGVTAGLDAAKGNYSLDNNGKAWWAKRR